MLVGDYRKGAINRALKNEELLIWPSKRESWPQSGFARFSLRYWRPQHTGRFINGREQLYFEIQTNCNPTYLASLFFITPISWTGGQRSAKTNYGQRYC